ncbi:MAG TPA: DUF2061 domain-containing protein [Flavobacteriales bacterium]|nr:DUF2061 domain-containing protein [Flavobacteriales bacterium]
MRENKNINLKPKLERKRHIAKTITWRIVGSVDTWLISWILIQFFGENPQEAVEAASYIASLELITKTILYYLHERVWYNLNWITDNQKLRHIIKTISWRLVGAIDTILLVFIVYYYLFNTTKGASEVALSIFSIELITKMILYYFHERIWFASNFGVVKSKN